MNRSAARQRGIAVIEMAIVLPVLLLLTFGVTELGRMMYQYNTLNKASRDAARYLATNASAGSTGVISITNTLDTRARNLAVYGNTTGEGAPVVAGLATGNVTVTIVDDVHIRVDIAYEYDPLFGLVLPTFGFGDGPLMAFDLVSSNVMRVL